MPVMRLLDEAGNTVSGPFNAGPTDSRGRICFPAVAHDCDAICTHVSIDGELVPLDEPTRVVGAGFEVVPRVRFHENGKAVR